ncbi:MAG TPA: efflux RND transporter periplasmic adaptor subunit, partial [Candidatus Polarisedimenticolia bacterium]|nr:efflux RND transporter periplasmic adaptor subunit [Candidatus Polarisedimenticolia bacterium]
MNAQKNTEPAKPMPELASLRIHRDAARPRRPLGWLLFGSVACVGVAVGAYFILHEYFGAVQVDKVTASLVTQGQALTVLSVTGYVEAETRADISPKITSRITDVRVTEGTRVKKGDVL